MGYAQGQAPVIRATCHTADDALTVEFDATPWFQEADPASILQVAGQGWSSAWIADGLEKRPGYERLHQLIDYATNRLGEESLEDRANPPGSWSADKLCDMCGRPLWRKKNFLDWCSARSGADMCAAFDAAHTPQARMGVRGSGPNQSHALEAPVAKLVFPIPSQ